MSRNLILERNVGTYYSVNDELYILETFSDDPSTVVGSLSYPGRLFKMHTVYPIVLRVSKNGITASGDTAFEENKETHPEHYL